MRVIRKAGFAIALVGLLALGACGGGSGGSNPQSAINSSASAFDEIINFYIVSCINFPCNCPGGGTIEAPATGQLLLVNCKASNGQSFSGTVTFDGDSITFNFQEFGSQCDGISGTVTGITAETCSGMVSGTCADEFVTCQMSTNCETCTI